MKAPEPNFTSSTSASSDSASFLLMMLAVISGMQGTVPVTSRSPYSLRSAGASSCEAPVITQPISCVRAVISDSDKSVRKPVCDSSLSRVPPVGPRPRPESIGTCRSQQASSGASGSDTLSPTPPVECLSTRT